MGIAQKAVLLGAIRCFGGSEQVFQGGAHTLSDRFPNATEI